MTDHFDIKQTDQLLKNLDNEIEQKCLEIKENRKHTILKSIFFLGCLAAAVIFGFNAFTGFQYIRTFIYLFLFQGVSLIFLIPIIINLNGGQNDVQRIG
ncbi:MAG: hypothetical protein GX434_00785 [Peptococcaceae bacterium]|nr:hypothetical protein [Peptococcaceae bacterium]